MYSTQIRYLHYYSSDLSCLFDGIESLLFPMTWQHTLIPALPLARTVFLEAPTPYLIGILYSETGDDTESKIIKHEYLRSRAYICLSLSSPCDSYLSVNLLRYSILNTIEILVLTSWIPASKNF